MGHPEDPGGPAGQEQVAALPRNHDPREPEKHWGLFTVDRRPKLAMKDLYRHMLR